jgi:hypothetical protein
VPVLPDPVLVDGVQTACNVGSVKSRRRTVTQLWWLDVRNTPYIYTENNKNKQEDAQAGSQPFERLRQQSHGCKGRLELPIRNLLFVKTYDIK